MQHNKTHEKKVGETFFVEVDAKENHEKKMGETFDETGENIENSGAVTFVKSDTNNIERENTAETSVHNETTTTTTKEPEMKINFSLNLSELDLSLSPDNKGNKINVPNLSPRTSEMTTKSDAVVVNGDHRRFSSGTYVTSPSFANLRDIASPKFDATSVDALQEDAAMEMSGIVPFSEPSILTRKPSIGHLDLADESQDDISLLVSILSRNYR